MTDTHIKCPNCGYEIPISEALSAQIRGELETSLKADHEARLRRGVAEAERRARGALDIELADLKAQITERAKQVEDAAARELELRRKARELDLEVARRLDEEKQRLEAAVRKAAAEEQDLKLKEKEKQIADLRQALDDAKRRSELGSRFGPELGKHRCAPSQSFPTSGSPGSGGRPFCKRGKGGRQFLHSTHSSEDPS
ncbi:MAG: hypothetical protein U9Q81_22600 [Pseudomonadota bacterium]|nr:hypothetical protein [Pseudomonadota bacterium]